MIGVSRTRKNALEGYAMKLNLNKTKLENVGLIINSKWPWLDASPDALADGDVVQLFEVKYPSAKRNQTIIIVCDDKKFRLEICNGVPTFKRQHPNFYQCQAIMAVTEINELDFVVYTLKEMHIKTIVFEPGKWNKDILSKLTNFLFDYVKENIIKDLT